MSATRKYTPTTPVGEPVEIRLDRTPRAAVAHERQPYVLTAANHDGLISYNLSLAGDGFPHAMSNLQCKGTWPRKAIAGWQAEVVETAGTGIYRIAEIR